MTQAISVILVQANIENLLNFVQLVIIVLQEHYCLFHVQQKLTGVELVQETFHIVGLVHLASIVLIMIQFLVFVQ